MIKSAITLSWSELTWKTMLGKMTQALDILGYEFAFIVAKNHLQKWFSFITVRADHKKE